ncbi:hypothetical protein [Lentilitoribacter sp. EG35]|uniref:hypothetical protein n=1 Tax=Lentilitoribacter sp. EG35 TaxID=3234192 RepID=UPI00346146CD
MAQSILERHAPNGFELDERGYWAEGNATDWANHRHAETIWLDDVLNDLVCFENVPPADIQIDKTQIGGYPLPIVRVRGIMRYMFNPFMEKLSSDGMYKPYNWSY